MNETIRMYTLNSFPRQGHFRLHWGMVKNALKFLIKLAVTGGLLLWLVQKAPLHELAGLWQGLHVVPFMAAVVLFVLAQMLSAVRWRLIAQKLRAYGPYPWFLRCYFVGMWFSQALPGGIGGDVVRVMSLARHSGRKGAAFNSVLLDRASGLGVLLAFTGIFLPVVWGAFGNGPLVWSIVALLCAGICGFVVLLSLVRLEHLYRRKATRWLWQFSRDVHRAFFKNIGLFAAQLGMSVLIQAATLVQFALLAQSLGLHLPWQAIAAFIPLVVLSTLLPVSLAGWGVREGALAALFGAAGLLNTPEALALGVLAGVMGLIAALPGGALWLLGQTKNAASCRVS